VVKTKTTVSSSGTLEPLGESGLYREQSTNKGGLPKTQACDTDQILVSFAAYKTSGQMKRDHFEDLKALVDGLMPNEVHTAKKFITAFEGNATKGRNKSLMLFELILKEPEVNEMNILKSFEKGHKLSSLKILADRLESKIFESLSLKVNLERSDLYSELYRIDKLLRKQLIEAKIAYGRHMLKKAVDLYDKIIVTAKRFEIYDLVIQALISKQQILGFTQGMSQHEKLSGSIRFFRTCNDEFLYASECYHIHFIDVYNYGLKPRNLVLLKNVIPKLKKAYDITNSKNIGYFLYTLQMEYHLILENYKKSCQVAVSLILLVSENKHLFTKIRIGGARSDLADNQLFLFLFKDSYKNASNALTYFEEKNYNYGVIQEIIIRSCYYQSSVNKSLRVAEKLCKITDPNITPFHYAKRVYLKACANFVQGEFKEALTNLQSTREIENDKEGWNIGKRLLTILIYLELDDWDAAETGITNLRMHIQRLKPEDTVRKRDAVILKVLQKLILTSFDYQQVLDKHPDLFELLDRTDRDYRWQVKSPEMVVFHHWFQDKAQGKAYQFRVPEPLMKKFGAKSPGRDLDFPVKYP